MSSSNQSTNSGPEPIFYQLQSGFDPSKSSNTYINNPQEHYQEHNNPLYFSCGSPGHHATDRIEANISSSCPTSKYNRGIHSDKYSSQSSSSTPVRTKVQQLETVVEDYKALFLGEYVTKAERINGYQSMMKSFEMTMILRIWTLVYPV